MKGLTELLSGRFIASPQCRICGIVTPLRCKTVFQSRPQHLAANPKERRDILSPGQNSQPRSSAFRGTAGSSCRAMLHRMVIFRCGQLPARVFIKALSIHTYSRALWEADKTASAIARYFPPPIPHKTPTTAGRSAGAFAQQPTERHSPAKVCGEGRGPSPLLTVHQTRISELLLGLGTR